MAFMKAWTKDELEVLRKLANCGRAWKSKRAFAKTAQTVLTDRGIGGIDNQIDQLEKKENLTIPIEKAQIDFERLDFLLGKKPEEPI